MHWPEGLTELSTPLPNTTTWLVLMCYGATVSSTGLKHRTRNVIWSLTNKVRVPSPQGRARSGDVRPITVYPLPVPQQHRKACVAVCQWATGFNLQSEGLGHKGATAARRHKKATRKRVTTPSETHAKADAKTDTGKLSVCTIRYTHPSG